MSGAAAQRLTAAEVRAIRRAAQRQIQRWAGGTLDAEQQQARDDLRRALKALKQFRDGCELHRVRPTQQERAPG